MNFIIQYAFGHQTNTARRNFSFLEKKKKDIKLKLLILSSPPVGLNYFLERTETDTATSNCQFSSFVFTFVFTFVFVFVFAFSFFHGVCC